MEPMNITEAILNFCSVLQMRIETENFLRMSTHTYAILNLYNFKTYQTFDKKEKIEMTNLESLITQIKSISLN